MNNCRDVDLSRLDGTGNQLIILIMSIPIHPFNHGSDNLIADNLEQKKSRLTPNISILR
ncbi:MAG: hypothetical protein PHI32_15725 [Dysgonamonadaceae bacterium]|nr:hypothetical protein [Dysgonamonadaceae bacterium]